MSTSPFCPSWICLCSPVVVHSVLLGALALGVLRLAGISCDKILCDAFDCCSAPLCALSGGDLLSENFMSLKQLSVVHLWCCLCGYVTLFIKTVVNKAFTTRTFCLCGVQLSNDQLMFCGGHFRINVVLQYCCSSWGPWVSRSHPPSPLVTPTLFFSFWELWRMFSILWVLVTIVAACLVGIVSSLETTLFFVDLAILFWSWKTCPANPFRLRTT